MRPIPLAVLALLLAASLAGCADGGGKDTNSADTGRIDQTVIDADPGETAGGSQATTGGKADAAPGNGEIRGSVQDDAGLPVADALVSLLGTALSGTTDTTGAFRFANVSSGTHGLRVVGGAAYRVHEGEVHVVAGKVTLVTVTLVPVDGRGPGYRPHLHDYWGTDTEVALIDQEYDLRRSAQFDRYGPAGQVVTGGYEPNNSNWWWPLPIPEERDDDRPPIVLPGTKEVRVTLTWEDDIDMDAFIVGYTTAAKATETRMAPQANGEPRTILLEEGDADNGHQGFSLWSFLLRPSVRTAPPGTTLGNIHVSVVLVRGAVPVEPSHEDFWNGTSTLVLRSFDLVDDVNVRSVTGCGETENVIRLPDGVLVPPGTARLALRFNWAAETHAANDGVFQLSWKPADLPPGAPYSEYQTAPPASSPDATTRAYDLKLDPGQTDAFYQARSNWAFYAKRTDLRADPNGVCLTNTEQDHAYRLEVIAHKDPAFT